MTEPILVTTHVARDFIQNAAYFNTVPKVVWEYVSNSVDNPRKGPPVHVEVSLSKERVVVSDDGCGMSREGLSNFFQMHSENIRRGRGERVRGRYGTGKCAAFGIADALRIESIQNGLLNIVELNRRNIEESHSGQPFPVKDITIDRPTSQGDGTRVIISRLNVKNVELLATQAYVERHLGRQLQNHVVVINGHFCEYQEPAYISKRDFQPVQSLSKIIGGTTLTVKVSPFVLETERAGIDILSRGIWHDTTHGTLEGEAARRIFGEIDVPILEDKYDEEKIPPFDNTRNMTLNKSNPIVATLLGWIDECLQKVAEELSAQEKERKSTEEALRLAKQAQQLERILNEDFRNLQMELERIRRSAPVKSEKGTDQLVPGEGLEPTGSSLGGPPHGNGTAGGIAGPGDDPRPGSSLLPGNDTGTAGKVTQKRHGHAMFRVEHRHEGDGSERSHYDKETRTIIINLDHPQIRRAVKDSGGVEGHQFREVTFEIAIVEYSVALGREREGKDEFYSGSDALWDVRDAINRLSRIEHI